MGEAKRRGTYEQRKAAAVERNIMAAAERELRHQKEWRALTPEQKKQRLNMTSLVALAMGAAIPAREGE
jgi:hypothetical protein